MKTKTSLWMRRLAGLSALFLVFTSFVGQASARILFQDDTVGTFESENLNLGSNDAGANNTSVKFGSDVTPSENGNINWNITTNTFEVDHTTAITGGLSATGQVNFSGAAGFRMREADPSTAACATVNELILSTIDGKIYKCTVTGTPGTWVSTAPSTSDFEAVYSADADKTLTTTNGAFTIAAGTGAVNINAAAPGGVSINNNINGAVNIATGTSTGAVNVGTGAGNVSVGNATGTVGVTSSTWNISTAGAATGLTGVTSTGTVNFSGAGAYRMRESANPTTSAACATVKELILNTTSNQVEICTVTGVAGAATWVGVDAGSLNGLTSGQFLRSDASSNLTSGTLTTNSGTTLQVNGTMNATQGETVSGGTVSLNNNSGANTTSIGTGTTTGTVSIGGNADQVAIDSSTWDISGAGVASGLTGLTSANGSISLNDSSAGSTTSIGGGTTTGTVTIGGTGAQTIAVGNGAGAKTVNLGSTNTTSATNINSGSGGLSLNANNNQATNINTGTSSGAVNISTGSGNTTIGNPTGTVGVVSSTWNVSTAGAATGLTGVTSTGTVNFSGASAQRLRESSSPNTLAACATLNEVIVDTTAHDIKLCTTTGIAGVAVWTSPQPAVPTGSPNPVTCSIGQLFFNTTSTTLQVCTSANTWSTAGPQDFESVYAKDADKILTTSNGNFTVAAGSGVISNTATGGINLNDSTNGAVNIGTGTSTGTVTLGGTGTQTIAVGNGAGVKTVNLGSTNTTSATTIASGSTAGVLNVNASNGTAVTNIGTGTTSGTVSIGGNADQVAIDSSTWDISGAGVASGLTGLTSANGAVSLNNNSGANTTGIGTGTTTGAVTIGGGSDTVQINSSNWKVSTAGVASGLTGITSTGTIDLTGATRFAMAQFAGTPGTCTKGDEVFNTTDSFVYLCTATNTWVKQASGKLAQMNWEPEYPDTVVFKSGSNNNGTLISDYDSTNFHQFYDWTSSRNTLQSIDLRFRYKLPTDFTSTGNLTLRLRTLTTSTADNKIDLTLRNDTDNTTCSTTIDKQVSGTANTWDLVTMTAANINTGCTGGTALAAGKIIEIQIRNYAKSTGATDVGTVNLVYTN